MAKRKHMCVYNMTVHFICASHFNGSKKKFTHRVYATPYDEDDDDDDERNNLRRWESFLIPNKYTEPRFPIFQFDFWTTNAVRIELIASRYGAIILYIFLFDINSIFFPTSRIYQEDFVKYQTSISLLNIPNLLMMLSSDKKN